MPRWHCHAYNIDNPKDGQLHFEILRYFSTHFASTMALNVMMNWESRLCRPVISIQSALESVKRSATYL